MAKRKAHGVQRNWRPRATLTRLAQVGPAGAANVDLDVRRILYVTASNDESPMARAEREYRACRRRIDELKPRYLAGQGDEKEWEQANAALGRAIREIFRLQEEEALARLERDKKFASELLDALKHGRKDK